MAERPFGDAGVAWCLPSGHAQARQAGHRWSGAASYGERECPVAAITALFIELR